MASQRVERIASHMQAAFSTEVKTPIQAMPTASHVRKPMKVVVTGAAGNIAYSIIFMIGQGAMLGPDQPVEIRLLDIPAMASKLQGVEMELSDCAFPLVTSIISTTDYKVAFQDVEVALLIGAKPRGPGMERKDLMTANAAIFSGQGKALNAFANRNVKVLVVGNPANTNALIAQVNAPNIPPQNFTAMTRLDHHRAASQIAAKVGTTVDNVKNVIIWGNHSKTQFPDVNHGYVFNFPTVGVKTPIRAAARNDKWLNTEFLSTVQDRGAAVIKARGSSSAASAANAAVAHIRSWFLGTPQGEYVSMAVPSDGSYGIPKGLVFSFPCICDNGQYQIVQGLALDDFSREKIRITTEELLSEKKEALGQ